MTFLAEWQAMFISKPGYTHAVVAIYYDGKDAVVFSPGGPLELQTSYVTHAEKVSLSQQVVVKLYRVTDPRLKHDG